MFHFPDCSGVRREFTSTTKIMWGIGDQFLRHAAAGIKVRHKRCVFCIDRNQNAFVFTFPFKDTLFIGQENGAEITVIECLRGFFNLGKAADKGGQFRPLRCSKAGA